MPGHSTDVLPGITPTRKPSTSRPPLLRPGVMNGNRDWIIGLECHGDTILVYPSRKAFTVTDLEGGRAPALLQATIRDMIARRQASVLPGEPPYRPLIRFLVRPDGLRVYYVAYPLLEALHLSMGRVDIHSDDELRRSLYPGTY